MLPTFAHGEASFTSRAVCMSRRGDRRRSQRDGTSSDGWTEEAVMPYTASFRRSITRQQWSCNSAFRTDSAASRASAKPITRRQTADRAVTVTRRRTPYLVFGVPVQSRPCTENMARRWNTVRRCSNSVSSGLMDQLQWMPHRSDQGHGGLTSGRR